MSIQVMCLNGRPVRVKYRRKKHTQIQCLDVKKLIIINNRSHNQTWISIAKDSNLPIDR